MTDTQRATVRRAVAPILGEPRISAPLTSQAIAGEMLTVLESQDDWKRVRCFDGYEGWTHAGYLSLHTADTSGWPLSLGCTVLTANGHTVMLPLGARIAPTDTVLQGEVLAHSEQASRFPLQSAAIAHSAETLFSGASYQWGGVTPWGCDCSGFVQRLFLLHGMVLPRDAWQQAMVGTRVAGVANAAHEAGDLLFFSDRDDARVTHVGIALGDRRMVHSALRRGGIAIEQLDADDAYVARLRAQCTGVQRVL